MDLPRATSLLLRQAAPYFQSSPSTRHSLPRFLHKSRTQRIATTSCRRTPTLTPSGPHRQQAAATAEKEPEVADESPAPPESSPTASQPTPPKSAGDIEIENMRKFIQSTDRPPRFDRFKKPGFRLPGTGTPQRGGERTRRLTAEDYANVGRPRIDYQSMRLPGLGSVPDFANPGDDINRRHLAEQADLERLARPAQPDTSPAPFRMGPALGRTVDVPGTKAGRPDLARAFRQLEMQCSRNSVRYEFNKQRFHERPGLRRKRLASQRWRRRFKADFQAVCRRVEELKRKGW